jgi:hypothetical protein
VVVFGKYYDEFLKLNKDIEESYKLAKCGVQVLSNEEAVLNGFNVKNHYITDYDYKFIILAENTPSKPIPPLSQVMQKGIKPILDEIGDRIRASKNYRIAEKDGKFWIEKLVINKTFSVGGLIFDVQQEWKCVPNPLFSKSLNESKKDLEDLIEKEIIKQSNKTKYNYL